MRPTIWALSACLALAPTFTRCASPAPIHGVFVTPANLDELSDVHFLDHPFPSDMRREPDGTVRLTGMPNPTLNLLVTQYEEATKGLLDGFSPAAAEYFLFDGDLDPRVASRIADRRPRTDVLDPADRRRPVVARARQAKARRVVLPQLRRRSYWLPHTLAVAPAHGYPLRPNTRYALVVTRDARADGGGLVLPSKDLARGARPASARARARRRRTTRSRPPWPSSSAAGVTPRSHRAADRVHDERPDRRALSRRRRR